MSAKRWRSSLVELRELLAFWGTVDDGVREGEAKAAWERAVRDDLATRADAVLDAFAARWQARYDEAEATRGTVTARSNSLLVFVGVITAGGGLIGRNVIVAPIPIVIALLIIGGLLLYAALAAAVLAIRAQRVQRWESPRVDPADATDERTIKLTYAVEVFVAAEQNRARLRAPVAFLRDGQAFAIAGLVLLAVLVLVSFCAGLAVEPPPT